jgi:ribosomal protein S18 acetylase RimI-like enzyme
VSDLTIRFARPEDRADVFEIAATVFDGNDYIPYVWDAWLAEKPEEGFLMVGETASKVVAIQHVELQAGNVAWLEGIRVHERYRNRGMARHMLRRGLELARESGMVLARLSVSIRNEASKSLVTSEGFHELDRFYSFSATSVAPSDGSTKSVDASYRGAADSMASPSDESTKPAGAPDGAATDAIQAPSDASNKTMTVSSRDAQSLASRSGEPTHSVKASNRYIPDETATWSDGPRSNESATASDRGAVDSMPAPSDESTNPATASHSAATDTLLVERRKVSDSMLQSVRDRHHSPGALIVTHGWTAESVPGQRSPHDFELGLTVGSAPEGLLLGGLMSRRSRLVIAFVGGGREAISHLGEFVRQEAGRLGLETAGGMLRRDPEVEAGLTSAGYELRDDHVMILYERPLS